MPQKKSDATAIQKMIDLFSLLVLTGREYTLSELASKLQCSKQTVMRMMEDIRRTGRISIETRIDKGRRHYRVIRNYQTTEMPLTPESLENLYMCREIVRHIMPGNVLLDIDTTLAKAGKLVPADGQKNDDNMTLQPTPFSLPVTPVTKGTIDYTPHQEKIETIFEALRERKLCNLVYRANPSSPVKECTIAIIRLITYGDSLYIESRYIGVNVPTNYLPTFAVHRIQSITLLERGHRFDTKESAYFKKPDKHFGFLKEKPFEVTLRLSPRVAYYIAERRWSTKQSITFHKDNSADFTFTTTSFDETVNFILSFGPEAQVISPKNLRDHVIKGLKDAVDRYQA